MSAPETIPLTIPRSRGAAAWLREQCRFSLAAMIEWLFGYALAFTGAWARADHRTLAGSVATLLTAGIVCRIAVRAAHRRFSYFVVLAMAIAAGVYLGGAVLRHERKAQVARLLAEDQGALAKLEELERQLSSVQKTTKLTAEDAWLTRVRRRCGVISAHGAQMDAAAECHSLWPAPLPQAPDDWTPKLLPVEERFATPITLKMDNGSFADFMEAVEQETGLRCEFAGEPMPADRLTLDFNHADLAWIINTINIVTGVTCVQDRQAGRLEFRRKE